MNPAGGCLGKDVPLPSLGVAQPTKKNTSSAGCQDVLDGVNDN